MTKKKNVIIIISIILFAILFTVIGLWLRDSSLKRADYDGHNFEFDGKIYEEINYREIGPYKETWKVVCKTKDGVWTIYEIEQYPEHEYLVARTGWEASVLKQIN